jgi:hypothetical protein
MVGNDEQGEKLIELLRLPPALTIQPGFYRSSHPLGIQVAPQERGSLLCHCKGPFDYILVLEIEDKETRIPGEPLADIRQLLLKDSYLSGVGHFRYRPALLLEHGALRSDDLG